MKLLVANRGEIAVRILRTCREMGLPSVAVFTEPDRNALHVRSADESICLGEARAYLDGAAVLEAARRSGATAIHPGYGFLAENAAFARSVEEAGLVFVGPPADVIARMGDKLAARRAARDAGLPVLPGTDDPLPREYPPELARQARYPVLVKAVAGGGGRGIRLARSAADLPEMIAAARQEALSAFGDDAVYLESLVQQARHIEVQILGDGRGAVCVLGDRECSIQRRRQKLIEEAPAPGLTPRLRARLHEAARRLGAGLNYRSLGTVEFLLDGGGRFYFIEVNPRIQVEHPVTEMVTGLDLVREQLRLAAGEAMALPDPSAIAPRGASIEARLLAEDPGADFLPTTGAITHLREPGGPGVRVDSALFPGWTVGADYDSLLAKVIVWDADRTAAIARLQRALEEVQIGGVITNLEFLSGVVRSPAFVSGEIHTTYLESYRPEPAETEPDLERELALAAALFAHRGGETARPPANSPSNAWRSTAWREQMRGA